MCVQAEKPQTLEFQGNKSVSAPAVTGGSESGLPEGNQWRYSEFINAVQSGKVERVRFAKDGTQLQLTAVDGESCKLEHNTLDLLCCLLNTY